MIDEPYITCATSSVYDENELFSSDSKVGVPKNDRQGLISSRKNWTCVTVNSPLLPEPWMPGQGSLLWPIVAILNNDPLTD
ncbi:hypothetical protein K443DRAFT_191584 [Laccaria amethystina LaAM-08-1]|uniref:Unplaced genomic scaffold K443scaffold_123, whole genome shotgun sequence n=1 Tax=Laccaria amethystina LaAM-08-1 TaxID=1095629 RepID=A0A0C9XBQ6_9AGAR|nr:hypothetical protein K443DRAFT_191584 [Laccaria amethystina LaAM-08-1]